MFKPAEYTCSCCGKTHNEWPALAYDSPTAYTVLTEKTKQQLASLDTDFCIINHPGQTDRFIRCVLWQKVNNHCEALQYGLWVSLSEKSFSDYSENYSTENYETKYFGWLSNELPEYDFVKSIPTTVYTQAGNKRPEIVPHEDFNHPFVRDYYNGITKKEAEKRIRDMVRSVSKKNGLQNKQWRFW